MNTAAEVSAAIAAIVEERRIAAERSEYDWKVSVGAVGAAAALIRGIPVAGTAQDYLGAVLSALRALCEDYYDPDGEYTSGKSDIGSIVARVEELARRVAGTPR